MVKMIFILLTLWRCKYREVNMFEYIVKGNVLLLCILFCWLLSCNIVIMIWSLIANQLKLMGCLFCLIFLTVPIVHLTGKDTHTKTPGIKAGVIKTPGIIKGIMYNKTPYLRKGT